jgi:hypothetical protein
MHITISGEWFQENVTRKVGDGVDTCFWHDPWLGGVSLSVRFSRLFELADDRSCTVLLMSTLGWEEGRAAWRWRRQLWVWEEKMLRECIILLRSVSLQLDVTDS